VLSPVEALPLSYLGQAGTRINRKSKKETQEIPSGTQELTKVKK
jgi:hypothetical protein